MLRKCERKFPDGDDDCVHKNREHSVLKFPGEIAADPRIAAQDWPMAFRPTARHVCEHGQNGQFIVVVPKQERIVPEKNEAKEYDD